MRSVAKLQCFLIFAHARPLVLLAAGCCLVWPTLWRTPGAVLMQRMCWRGTGGACQVTTPGCCRRCCRRRLRQPWHRCSQPQATPRATGLCSVVPQEVAALVLPST